MHHRYEHFSQLIASLSRSIQKIERGEMEQYGFRAAYAQYLAVLSAQPDGLTSAQLADATCRDKAAVSRMIAEMEDLGLVSREHGYRARLSLTPAGRDAADFVRQRARDAITLASGTMEAESLATMYRCLETIATNLETAAEHGLSPKEPQ